MGQASYKTTKFHRQRDQRKALLRGLADSLVLHESIETTLPKAKAVVSYTEKLITSAKLAQANLNARRRVIRGLQTLEAAHKLVDDIAPKLTARKSGHLRIQKTITRKGDGTLLAKVSFVDDLTVKAQVKKESPKVAEEPKKIVAAKPATKKPASKQEVR